MLLVLVPACEKRADRDDQSDSPRFARLMNEGKAYLENRNSAKAIEALAEAAALRPQSVPALRNLARAQFLGRDHEGALATLARVETLDADSPANGYLTGLNLIYLSRYEDAIPSLERAVRFDPRTATLRYQLAGAYQATEQADKAYEQLLETVRLDPLHASAHFRLSSYARKAGDRKEVERRMREFQRLTKLFGDATRNRDMLERCIYTEPEAMAQMTAPTAKPAPAIPVQFTDVTDEVFRDEGDARAVAVGVIEVDHAGNCTLIVMDPAGALAFLAIAADGTFQRTNVDTGAPAGGAFDGLIVGDFHDVVPEGAKFDPSVHALSDVLLYGSGGVRLLRRSGRDSFDDVTAASGLSGLTALAARWVDYEYDGDLDLVVARDAGLALWQNNGNATFTDVTAEVGITATLGVRDIVPIDLDGNLAADIVTTRGTSPTLVFENQRAGRFARMKEPPGPWPAAERVLADDVNNDGLMDVVLIARDGVVTMMGGLSQRPRIELTRIAPSAAALLDYDNDGRLDLCIVGSARDEPASGAVRLWRNAGGTPGGKQWTPASDSLGTSALDLPGLKDVVAADVDNDGDTDLILVTAGGSLRLLRNDGGHVGGQLKLRLTSLKTNPSCIGTRIEAREGAFLIARSATGPTLEIGLGGRQRFDTIQTVWTNGVVDNQIDVACPDVPLSIVEKNVATGSCPFLYVWDGGGFRFVTDLLGNAPVGLPLTREIMLPADPDEIVWIGDAKTFPPRDGMLTIEITDEFREVLYLDYVKLVAVDHPPEIEVHPTDKLMPSPFPPSEVWGLARPVRLRSVVGDDGMDRTEAVRAIDGLFAPPGEPLPSPYRGMCHPLTLTMDFGPLDPQAPLVLALTGWLQYGDASTNIALSQDRSLTIIPPTIEVEVAPGDWRGIDVVVGMPAGKTKTILCDLDGKLPTGATRLRLSTTFEIRWDRIALFERVGLEDSRIRELSAVKTDLHWRGFSDLRSRAAHHPSTPDYAVVSPTPPWRTTLQGW
ncbi:MAG: VCBS repeat-containing protein, partial [Planctomycetes bacterium]|nr:VCBS repeat-containing protein [Planctomycetota bacterium]